MAEEVKKDKALGEVKEQPYGRYQADFSGYENCWVQFKPRGYTWKMRRKWEKERREGAILLTICRWVEDWYLLDVDGQPIPLPTAEQLAQLEADLNFNANLPEGEAPREIETPLDNAEGSLVTWLIFYFTRWLIQESTYPPKARPAK